MQSISPSPRIALTLALLGDPDGTHRAEGVPSDDQLLLTRANQSFDFQVKIYGPRWIGASSVFYHKPATKSLQQRPEILPQFLQVRDRAERTN